MIKLSDNALLRLRELKQKHNKKYVRLDVKGGGCAGFNYEWSFADEETRNDVVVDDILLIDRIDKEKMKQMAKKNPSMGHSHSNSLLLSPGEKGELVWKFSNKSKLEAACNVPGHYEVGMIAKINEI